MSDRPQGNYSDLNSWEFGGRIGVGPESRTTSTGKSMTTAKIPVSESYNGKESTTWVKVVAFGAAADQLAQFRKGDKVKARGKIKLSERDYNGKHYVDLECMVWEVVGASESFAPREPRAQGERRETGHQGRQEERRGPVEPVGDGGGNDFDDPIPF